MAGPDSTEPPRCSACGSDDVRFVPVTIVTSDVYCRCDSCGHQWASPVAQVLIGVRAEQASGACPHCRSVAIQAVGRSPIGMWMQCDVCRRLWPVPEHQSGVTAG